MQPGIYILILSNASAEVVVGSLGVHTFSAGYHAYVGSALGPGGLARVSRHIRLSRLRDKNPRWHIDYLLTDERFSLIRVYCVHTSDRLECPLAQALDMQVIPDFGSSDCSCPGHLFYSPGDPEETVTRAFRSLTVDHTVHHLN
ncbi:MAG: DUF123 domain-containing protein [Methanobacteriota archaeon]